MCEDICIYVFGYGSLIWRPGFPYLRKFDGYIRGWKRLFWQGSTDHRGTPEAPGRVVTLVKDPHSVTWGTVYCIPDEEAATILKNLDYREKGGYIREEVDVYIHGRDAPVVTKSILYVASEKNGHFLGESTLEEVAHQIYRSVGPSGPNVDYLLNLADSMRKMNAIDPHITALETLVLDLVKVSPLSHHTHPTLLPLHANKTSDPKTIVTTITSATLESIPSDSESMPSDSDSLSSDSDAATTQITTTLTQLLQCEYANDQAVPVNPVNISSETSDMQRKYFLSPRASVKGVICIDDGAVMAVSQRGRSLLAAGIASVVGDFDANELVSVVDSAGGEIARGITTYGSDEILKIKGLHSTKISNVLGFTRGETVVHHHNMILV